MIIKVINIIKNLTKLRGISGISERREVLPPAIREVSRPITDSFSCPYCFSKKFIRRGFRQKKLEKVQLYLCLDCHKTFTPQITKGKHYPLEIIFRAVSLYHLGYSLEETCRIINEKTQSPVPMPKLSDVSERVPADNCEPAANIAAAAIADVEIAPSTLSNWLSELDEFCPYRRFRPFALQLAKPKDMVLTATLAHQQLYRYRFHQIKTHLIISEDIKHRRFGPLKEFLEMVPVECPHQYFQKGLRASEAPLTFSKTQMIVRSKKNYATKICSFVLQSVKERKNRHEALQKFMLANDTVTVATEVPVYLTLDDLEHFQTQLGFTIYNNYKNYNDYKNLPNLITGHIDFVQIRNGQIHLLDYKPNAEKERPIEQLTLYAMALSRLTGLRLFEFKCAWFDEKDYFEFYPLHVLHKPYKTRRKRKVYTMEGIYNINKEAEKIKNLRPVIPNVPVPILSEIRKSVSAENPATHWRG